MAHKTTIITLSLIAIGAFLLRVLPHLSAVYAPWGVNFFDVDPYYHLRLTEYMVANFPGFLTYDQYALFPDGAAVSFRPFMQYVIAIPALIIGLGHPSLELIQNVAVWAPPLAGSLLVVPVYFLGREVFSARTGLIGAGIVAVLPTELLHRSFLGYTDQHIFEVVLSVCVILFLVMGLKRNNYWLSMVSGIFLGLYLWNWHGGMFLAAIIYLWYLITLVTGKPRDFHVSVCYAGAFVVFSPFIQYSQNKTELLLIPLALSALIFYFILGKVHGKGYLALVGGLLAAAVLVVYFTQPVITDTAKVLFLSIFWGFGTAIQEAVPADMRLIVFTLGFVSVLTAFGYYLAFRHKVSLLFIVWSMVLLLAMIGQRRWGYYTTVPIALLAAFCVDRILANTGKRYKSAVFITLAIIVLCSLIPGNLGLAKSETNMDESWYKASIWLKENTPAPFNSDDYLIKDASSSKYAVLAWWDYGHFIIQLGHRVPLQSPTQQVNPQTAKFLTATSPEEAEEAIKDYNIQYVMLDRLTFEHKYYAIYRMANSGSDAWRESRTKSMAYKLYNSIAYGDWKFLKQFGQVRIYERRN